MAGIRLGNGFHPFTRPVNRASHRLMCPRNSATHQGQFTPQITQFIPFPSRFSPFMLNNITVGQVWWKDDFA